VESISKKERTTTWGIEQYLKLFDLEFPFQLIFTPTIPDKRVGTRSKFSPPPTFNVDNQVIFALFVGKNVIFSNID